MAPTFPPPSCRPSFPRAGLLLGMLLICVGATPCLRAATISAGNVTATLGPTFFIDDAANGGTDTDYFAGGSYSSNRTFSGLLTRNQGPTRVTLTGFGFAAHTSATSNNATSVNMTFTYLGANEVFGGGDDVSIGTVTGTYNFTVGGEYVFAFDAPLSADLNITSLKFGITIQPNGTMKLKSGTIPNQTPTATGPRFSVAGVASPIINPRRVNLAKYQTVTASSVSGNRLASYATDGDAGNDSRWQSQNSAFNNARIDFPFPVEIGSAQVFMGVDDTLPLAQFGIQALIGGNWTTINGANVVGNTNVERNVVFTAPVTASSFRIMVTDPTIRLREFALYPPNGPTGYPLGTDINLNLALQRPAVASSFVTGRFPLNAVDGRTHTGSAWETTTSGVNTLDIELVASTKIGSAHLYSGSETSPALADFTLKYWDGTSWVNIPGGTITGNSNSDRVVAFTTPVTTTRVRLEFTKPGTTPTVIRELQIFPANTGNAGYPLGTNINPSGAYADYEDFNDGFHEIRNVGANRTIAVDSGGQPVLEPAGFATSGGRYQILLNLADGTYRLRNRDTGECLSGAQLSKTPGALLTDEPYTALPHQDWILEPLGGGHYRIVNAWSGLAIDTQGGATAPGTALAQNTPSNATSQKWRLIYATWAPKKGLGHGSLGPAMNANWFYNWGPTSSQILPSHVVFHPMQWGSFNWAYNTGSGPIWQHLPTWRKRGDGMVLMGFNEPDRVDQSNISLEDCVALWPRLMALNQPLLSPSPGTLNPPVGVPSWHELFYNEANRLGYRVEHNAIHTYPGPSGGSSDGLVNLIQAEYNDFGRPVWLTEFSFVDWGGNQSWSEEDNYQTLAEFLWRTEGLTALRKYALFVFTESDDHPQPPNSWTNVTPAPRSNSYDRFGNLTAFGRLYAAWDSDTTIRADKTYMIHHRGLRKRMANAATGNTNPGGRTIRTDGPTVNWTLVPTGVANRYYVESAIDGRRLSHTTGTGVAPTLAAAGTTGANVEWTVTPTTSEPQKGWYHIGHPGSNTRLRLASFNTSNNVASYQMVATSTTDESVQWRFIVPLPANSAPVMAPIPDQVVNELTLLTLTANATDASLPTGNLTYSILNPPFGASINATTGAFRWTPTEAQGNGTTYALTIRASDGQMAAERMVNITVNEVNSVPALAAIPSQAVNSGSLLTFTANGTDADLPANTLTYSLIGAPSGATIGSSSGIFSWTPSFTLPSGNYTFTVQVGDGGLTASRSVVVALTNPLPSNQADDDGDGLSNLLEYASGTQPNAANPSPLRIVDAGPGATVTLEFTWNWQAAGVTWQILHGSDLANTSAWSAVNPGTVTTVREGNIDRITVTPTMANPDRGFFLLKVVVN